jgi:multicomponent Na+:H+ antiporter subunit G
MSAHELISAVLMGVGAVFVLVASVGVLRLPDLFLRMSATSKAATLGVCCILLAAAVYFGELGIASRALAAIAFILLTAPVAAHRIGRAAYLSGVPLAPGTRLDELCGRYSPTTQQLSSPEDNGERQRSPQAASEPVAPSPDSGSAERNRR